MRPNWKLVGLAGLAGVAATGVVVARRRRAPAEYTAEELREKLHRRLEEATPGNGGASQPAAPGPAAGSR